MIDNNDIIGQAYSFQRAEFTRPTVVRMSPKRLAQAQRGNADMTTINGMRIVVDPDQCCVTVGSESLAAELARACPHLGPGHVSVNYGPDTPPLCPVCHGHGFFSVRPKNNEVGRDISKLYYNKLADASAAWIEHPIAPAAGKSWDDCDLSLRCRVNPTMWALHHNIAPFFVYGPCEHGNVYFPQDVPMGLVRLVATGLLE